MKNLEDENNLLHEKLENLEMENKIMTEKLFNSAQLIANNKSTNIQKNITRNINIKNQNPLNINSIKKNSLSSSINNPQSPIPIQKLI